MSSSSKILSLLLVFGLCGLVGPTRAQNDDYDDKNDLDLVEQLLVARTNYQKILEKLRLHYLKTGDVERAKWAEEELILYHRIPKRAFRLELDVPPPTLRGTVNITEANKLYTRAMSFKGNGWGTDYIDNQRRAEILFQQMLTKYPQSNRISDAAYQLGDIYENAPYKHYKRAALYFERCFQWDPTTHFDARIRAARIYDANLLNREQAMRIYKEVTKYETDAGRIQEAVQRMQALSQQR